MNHRFDLSIYMYKNIKLVIFIILFFIFVCNVSSLAKAQMQENLSNFGKEAKYNVDIASGGDLMEGKYGMASIIANIIRLFLTFLGIIFVLISIYAGYLWMTAGGNSEQVEDARKKLINAVIGLFIVLAAYAITYFFLENLMEIILGRRAIG